MISVVIPVYNAESFISKCVGSVLEQTFSDLELICVDDCSKDGSSKLLDGFDDPRVRVIRFAENRGVSAARNAGLEAAVGDYVYFLDSDDWLDPDYLEAMFLKAQETGEDIIVNSNYIEEFPNEGKRALSSRLGTKRTLSSVPPDFVWSSLPSDLMTAVGPCESLPWAGDVPSEMAKWARRPLGVAPQTEPK